MNSTIYWTAVSSALILAAVIAGTWHYVRVRQDAAVSITAYVQQWWLALKTVWLTQVRPNEQHKMQIIVGATGMIISISLGYIFAGSSFVDGWQLWTWLVTIIVLIAALVPFSFRPKIKVAVWHIPLALTIISLALRIFSLDTIPGGLHVDEMGVAGFAALHVYPPDGLTINPFHTGASSQPALYHNLIRLSFLIFGYSIEGLRITSVIAGALSVIATYVLVHVFANRRTALITAVILTTYHYHLHWSRIGLNNIWDTLWVPLILAFLVWGYRKNWSGGAALAGLALGLSQYFYAGNKISFFLLPFVLIMMYRENPDRPRMIVHVGKMVVTAVTVAAPITLFAFIRPDIFFDRSRVVFGWKPDAIIAAVGDYSIGEYLWQQIWRNFGAYTSVPEITGFYGPGVPYLIGAAAPLFIIGVLWALWTRQWIPLLWIFFTTVFGGILLSGAPSSSHYVVSIPAICWLTAVPITWLWENGRWRLAIFLIGAIIITDLGFYFGIYVPSEPRDLFNAIPAWPFES
jgi:4-amino-4-deoxy-L-arabinose transferase-like glycosyltransferase